MSDNKMIVIENELCKLTIGCDGLAKSLIIKENNLEVLETIVPISARLIANKASFKFKSEQIEKIVASMAKQTEENKK